MDAQTLHGKTPVGVARVAKRAGVPVIALAGSLGEGYQALHEAGIEAAFSLTPGPISLEQALADAAEQLQDRQAVVSGRASDGSRNRCGRTVVSRPAGGRHKPN